MERNSCIEVREECHQYFFVCFIHSPLSSGEKFYGQPKLQNLVIDGDIGVGDGRFWEDIWFGTAPLATQLWHLFYICNHIRVALSEVWDGVEAKITFRRNFEYEMLDKWFELVGNVSEVVQVIVVRCVGLAV